LRSWRFLGAAMCALPDGGPQSSLTVSTTFPALCQVST
jgi:hypothetical protein